METVDPINNRKGGLKMGEFYDFLGDSWSVMMIIDSANQPKVDEG